MIRLAVVVVIAGVVAALAATDAQDYISGDVDNAVTGGVAGAVVGALAAGVLGRRKT